MDQPFSPSSRKPPPIPESVKVFTDQNLPEKYYNKYKYLARYVLGLIFHQKYILTDRFQGESTVC